LYVFVAGLTTAITWFPDFVHLTTFRTKHDVSGSQHVSVLG